MDVQLAEHKFEYLYWNDYYIDVGYLVYLFCCFQQPSCFANVADHLRSSEVLISERLDDNDCLENGERKNKNNNNLKAGLQFRLRVC